MCALAGFAIADAGDLGSSVESLPETLTDDDDLAPSVAEDGGKDRG